LKRQKQEEETAAQSSKMMLGFVSLLTITAALATPLDDYGDFPSTSPSMFDLLP
jgi:hypothetical protein